MYIKFNKLANFYVIVISFHKQDYPLVYKFKWRRLRRKDIEKMEENGMAKERRQFCVECRKETGYDIKKLKYILFDDIINQNL